MYYLHFKNNDLIIPIKGASTYQQAQNKIPDLIARFPEYNLSLNYAFISQLHKSKKQTAF